MTVISFEVERTSRAHLAVYDTMGRHVRTLFDGAASGVQSVQWDGRDEAGTPVSAGVYFARVTADGFCDTKAMTLLR